MKKKAPNLLSQIARLGTGLAVRSRPAAKDIVVEHPKHLKRRVKYLGVYLNVNDMVLLTELESWARDHGLRPGWGTILKAATRMMGKDDRTLGVLRQMACEDSRRRRRDAKF